MFGRWLNTTISFDNVLREKEWLWAVWTRFLQREILPAEPQKWMLDWPQQQEQTQLNTQQVRSVYVLLLTVACSLVSVLILRREPNGEQLRLLWSDCLLMLTKASQVGGVWQGFRGSTVPVPPRGRPAIRTQTVWAWCHLPPTHTSTLRSHNATQTQITEALMLNVLVRNHLLSADWCSVDRQRHKQWAQPEHWRTPW